MNAIGIGCGACAVLAAAGAAFGQGVPLVILARAGQPYPTLPGGGTLENFARDPVIAPDGTVAFAAYVERPGSAQGAVLRVTPAGPEALALQATPAPVEIPGAVFYIMNQVLALDG